VEIYCSILEKKLNHLVVEIFVRLNQPDRIYVLRVNIPHNILVLLPKIVQTVSVQLYYEGIEVARHSLCLPYPDLWQCTPLGCRKINLPTNFAN